MHEKIIEISNINFVKHINPGLFTGLAGVSLFYYQLGKATKNDMYLKRAEESLVTIFDKIDKGFTYPTYCHGLAGIGCLMKYFVKDGFIEEINLDILNSFDNYLYKTMLAFINNKNYDYLHGAIGIGLYFLSRLPKLQAKKALAELIIKLDKDSLKNKNRAWVWWEITDISNKNELQINFSLSHGITNIAVFLGKCIEADIEIEKCTYLLNSTLNFILDNRNPLGSTSFFPSYLSEFGNARKSRLAWCYGDPGLCTALWSTAQLINHAVMQHVCLDALLLAATCSDVNVAMVQDAGICHGSAGLLLIFLRMYKNTGLEAFDTASKFWKNETLKMAYHKTGLTGYKAWHNTNGWQIESGLLEGVAGIGLALIAAEKNGDQNWDYILLLN